MVDEAANTTHSHGQPLISIECFSYSWLRNQAPENSSFRSCSPLDFIEMDPRLPPSRRFFVRAGSQDFNFTVPPSSNIPDSPYPLKQELDDPETDSSTPYVDHIVVSREEKPKTRCSSYAKRLLFKYFGCLMMPFCKRICNRSRSRRSSRVGAVYSCDNWRRSSCDSESSIHEAVLHCKRSININDITPNQINES